MPFDDHGERFQSVVEVPEKRSPIEIGLINNASDAAFDRIVARYRGVLERAANGRSLRLHVATLPGIIRRERPQARAIRSWSVLAAETKLDALIVTGAEPTVADLRDEPYWNDLAALFVWADRNGVPLVLSCLAAHAAVLHADGIVRVALPEKRFGVFRHEVVGHDPLVRGMPAQFDMPHSRWNAVRERDLSANGYLVLTSSDEAGVDMFVRRQGSPRLHLQGHPEYRAGTLLGEYRRDVGRALRGEANVFPAPPAHLDERIRRQLDAFRMRVADAGDVAMTDFPDIAPGALRNSWSEAATTVFGNWLDRVEHARCDDFAPMPAPADATPDAGLRA